MIVFDLVCAHEHRFEGWFASADDFEQQRKDGLLSCPVCADGVIEKLPSARIGGFAEPAPAAGAVSKPATGDVAERSMNLARLLEVVLTHTEDVGEQFAEEARRMHYAEAPERAIRGVATRDETEALLDEGIPVLPLPLPRREDLN